MAITPVLIEALGSCLGPRGLLTDPADLAPCNTEQRGNYTGRARVLARPASTDECAAVVRLCREAGVSIVPRGGNTGLVGGSVAGEDQVLLSLERMTAIRWIDPEGYRMAVDGGCLLADVQRHAAEAGRLFPLSLGAEGSCRIGGNLASNAGGLNVLRYGPARSLCVGLEVVLPDGRIWDGLRVLEKDNTGYALKHLFIGSEGTLGIITGAVLKLFPRQTSTVTALCGLSDVHAVVPLLSRARAITGDEVSAFELMSGFAYGLGVRHLEGVRDALERPYPWYVLLELSTSRAHACLDETLAILLEEAFDTGLIDDAAVATSEARRRMLWALREGLPEAQKKEGASLKHDIGVPVSQIPAFLDRALPAVQRAVPGIRPCPFGHVGDGNLHFNLTRPEAMDDTTFRALREEINALVHDIVMDMNGTFSAEHGVGRLKTRELAQYRPAAELDLMRALKTAFDPQTLMNPGVIL